MNYNEFAEKIKTKYPDYKDVDNRELAEKIVAKHPEYKEQVSFDEQAGVKEKLLGMVGKAGQLLQKAPDAALNVASAVSPALGPIGMAADVVNANKVSEALGQPGQAAGQVVEEKVGGTAGKLAGFATGALLDPTNLLMGAGGARVGKAAGDAAVKGVKGVLPGTLKAMGNVPEEATQQLLKDTQLMAKHTGAEGAIETAVSKLQSALKNARSGAGESLGKIKKQLGVAVSFDEGIMKLANTAEKAPKTPAALAQEYLGLKATQGMDKSPAALKDLIALRQQIDDAVRFSNKAVSPISTPEEALLKQAAKDLNQMIEKTPRGKLLRAAEKGFSEAADIYDDLQKKLADPGQAEAALSNLFTSKNARGKDTLKAITRLEKMTGESLVEPLFKEFAAKQFGKWVGRPGVMGAVAGGASVGAFMNPIAAVGVPVAFAAQSPKILGAGVRGMAAATPAVKTGLKASGSVAGASSAEVLQRMRDYITKEQTGGPGSR
jgi:hypothetical protein